MAAPNVLETDRWLSEILQFRKNPVSFFTSRQMEAGDFVLDILQVEFLGCLKPAEGSVRKVTTVHP